MHTLKNQFIVLPQGQDIVDVTGEVGKTSDINLFHQNKFGESQKFLEIKPTREKQHHSSEETKEW